MKKVVSKILSEEAKHVGTSSRGHASRVRQETQGMFACEHKRSQATLTREYINTQYMLTCEARTFMYLKFI